MHPAPLGTYPLDDISRALAGKGLSLDVTGFRCRVRSDQGGTLAAPIRQLYADYPAALEPQGFHDLDIDLHRRRSGLFSREVAFGWDGQSPFPSLPESQAHPLFEWGLNWCIATLSGERVVIHAAVLEKDGGALVLPGDPGSGKSTLCAELCLSGWRLLSDELTIISRENGLVQPIPRPISLKDTSIRLIQGRHPGVEMTTPITDTRKGAIAYVRPPADAVRRWTEAVPIRHVLFPRYVAASPLAATPRSRARVLTLLLENTFNVGLLGTSGFTALAQAIAGAGGHEIEYGSLDDVVAWLGSVW